MVRNVTPRRGARVAKEGFARMDENELDAMGKMAWLDLIEKSNRTSPEEYPHMALISEEELGFYIRDAIASLRRQRDMLKEALTPIVAVLNNYGHELDEVEAGRMPEFHEVFVRLELIYAAANALASLDQEPQQ
jgi:hypothetical protein